MICYSGIRVVKNKARPLGRAFSIGGVIQIKKLFAVLRLRSGQAPTGPGAQRSQRESLRAFRVLCLAFQRFGTRLHEVYTTPGYALAAWLGVLCSVWRRAAAGCSRFLKRLDVLKQNLFVSLGIHLCVHLADDALGIDDEAGALPELHALPLGLAYAQGLHEAGVGIGQQVDVECELVAEVLVGGGVVGAHTHDLDAGLVEVGLTRGERLALDGAAGRVVLGVEVDDQPFAGEVGEAGGFSVLVEEREVWEGIAGLHHAETGILSEKDVSEILAGTANTARTAAEGKYKTGRAPPVPFG